MSSAHKRGGPTSFLFPPAAAVNAGGGGGSVAPTSPTSANARDTIVVLDASVHSTSITGFFLFELHAMTELVVAFTEPDIWSTQRRIENMLAYPLRELQDLWRILQECWHWTKRGPETFIYSLKLSTTMTAFVSYLLAKGVGDPMFGPSQMAFASGLDTTNAVNIWVSQLWGLSWALFLVSCSPLLVNDRWITLFA